MMGMNDMDDREDTNDSSLGTPGEEPSATMVPPTSLSTYVSVSFSLKVNLGFEIINGFFFADA